MEIVREISHDYVEGHLTKNRKAVVNPSWYIRNWKNRKYLKLNTNETQMCGAKTSFDKLDTI